MALKLKLRNLVSREKFGQTSKNRNRTIQDTSKKYLATFHNIDPEILTFLI